MDYFVQVNQKDLILKVNKNYDSSVLNLEKWEPYLDVLCGDREYQKEAIKSALIFLASGEYNSINDLVQENYLENIELKKSIQL